MIIVGEKLNSSIPKMFEKMKAKDTEAIRQIAISQQEAGARYLDINTAIFREDEFEMLKYILDIVLENTDCGIMLDSPSPAVIEKALPLLAGRDIIINSVTLQDRINDLLPLARSYKTGVVGLPIDSEGIPKTVEKRVENSLKLIEIMNKEGIKNTDIYIDALAEAVAVESEASSVTIRTIDGVRKAHPDVHLICGVSNVSFGLPKRTDINSVFLSAAIFAGLDSGIVDITNEQIKSTIYTAEMIAGRDEYCMEYLGYIRSK